MEMGDETWADRRVLTFAGRLVEEAWTVIEPNIAGLTDAEYHWEPVDGCWGVRVRDEVRSPDSWGSPAGEWAVEHCFDGSIQPAVSTIAWRMLHAADCTIDFTSRAFGHGGRDWNDIVVPGTAAGAVELLTGAIEDLRRSCVEGSDAVLHGTADVDDDRPRWLCLDKALLELIHHCAEVGVLRQMHTAFSLSA